MRAVVRSGSADNLVSFEHISEPILKKNRLLVQVEMFCVNRGELALLQHRPNGWTPGQEFVGTVLTGCSSGLGVPVGTRVAGLVPDSGWGERIAVDANSIAPLPDGLISKSAAALPLSGITALRTLRLCGTLLGRSVLLTAGSGGVGQLQIQLATLAGGRVTAVVRDKNMRKLIAAAVPSAHITDELGMIEGQFDVLLDSVGGETLGTALKRMRPNGLVILFGNSEGKSTSFSIFDFVGAEATTLRTYFSYHQADPIALDLALLIDLAHCGSLQLIAGTVRPWAQIQDALNEMQSSGAKTKQILTI